MKLKLDDLTPHETRALKGLCNGCDRSDIPIAEFDTSLGEYTPIRLCGNCLVDLANELLEVS